MMVAHVLTKWFEVLKGDEEPDRYQELVEWLVVNGFVAPAHPWSVVDVTGTPKDNLSPDPNLCVVEVVCDAATLAAIEADSRFFVLWSEGDEEA